MSTSKLKERVVRHSPSTGAGSPDVWGIYEPDTGSIQYICADPATKQAALIDVVWNLDPKNYRFSAESVDQVLDLVRQNGLSVGWVLDTHPHADHVMASALLKERTGAPAAIGDKVHDIAKLWAGLYNLPDAFDPARDFDHLFAAGETFRIGDLEARVMLSPGHTLGSITYVCGDAAFTHDTLMQPDVGTSRADFPGGDTEQLWDSIQAILALPPDTRLFVGHDYGTDDRDEPQWEATVAQHRASNKHVKDGTRREAWIKKRNERDATLPLPDRILAALQINLRGGRLPPAEADGNSYLKIPVNKFPAPQKKAMTMKEMVAEAQSRVAAISPEQAAKGNGSAALVLDVREPGELETHGRVPDALHVPRGLVESRADATAKTAEVRLTDLRDTGCVHVLCGSGARAALVADTLRTMGYDATVIEGGFEAWKAKGLPVED
jgi:glyoxylase-like metal-dependent hydrolase (beta-lactamase superfamily II)/rhodanese-related sulfurtransferase